MKNSSSPLYPPPIPHTIPVGLCSTSTSAPFCPELDISIELSPSCTPVKPTALRKSDQSEVMHQRLTRRKWSTQSCFDQPAVGISGPDITLNMLPQQKFEVLKNDGHQHRGAAPRWWINPPAVASCQNPDCLERAELNTTLALKKELQSLQRVEFNSQKIIEETLQRSERTNILINTRATEAIKEHSFVYLVGRQAPTIEAPPSPVVNVSHSQVLYNSLVSMDIEEDQFISQVLQERLLLVPPPRSHGIKAASGPSPLFFMTSGLIRQKPLAPEEMTADVKLCPFPHHTCSAFDLYRHICTTQMP